VNLLPLTIEALVAVLLLLTILYCVRLNAQLKRLKADESMMKTTIAELVVATESAERAITGLKMTVREAEQMLGERLGAAERFTTEMASQLEAGRDVLERVTQIAGARKPAQPAAETAPDPKAIAAAAQAFAERTRARANLAA
jgi:hypothetical protein